MYCAIINSKANGFSVKLLGSRSIEGATNEVFYEISPDAPEIKEDEDGWIELDEDTKFRIANVDSNLLVQDIETFQQAAKSAIDWHTEFNDKVNTKEDLLGILGITESQYNQVMGTPLNDVFGILLAGESSIENSPEKEEGDDD